MYYLSLFSPLPTSFLTNQSISNFTSFTWKLKDLIQDYVYKEESPGWESETHDYSIGLPHSTGLPHLVAFHYLLMLFPQQKSSDLVCCTGSALQHYPPPPQAPQRSKDSYPFQPP